MIAAVCILIISAAIFLSEFVFRFLSSSVFHKSHNNNNNNNNRVIPPPITVRTNYNRSSIPFNSTTASASSSYSLYGQGKFDVFLSFRGADTRRGFTDHLYNVLLNAGIYTFIDSERLHIGKEIGHHLLKSIEDSKIWIPIFSKNYANSKWCLRELSHIVKCQLANEGRKIYPIFYDVDVYDVKNQKGSYAKAFREHEQNFDLKTVREWREALKTVGKFKGYELKAVTNGHEGSLVKKLVKDVLLELKKNYTDVRDDHMVGMDHHVQEMTRLLRVDFDGVRIVGVHGMGGIGKTTIAKIVYNKLCDSFDGCSFLEDVREKVKQHPNGLVGLQKQLCIQIMEKDFADVVIFNDVIKKIKDVVHKKRVLIVLDDVDEKSQFDKLAGECDWFNKSSRIIVTTRNKEVLNALEATCKEKGLREAYKSYKPKLMTNSDSLKLFSKYAFMRDSPPEDYLRLSKEVTSIAARLPLVLVTLGSLFLGIRNIDRWEVKLEKLRRVPNKDVMGKLRISFDALDDDDKKIFLDIACFFIGKDKTEPYFMWEDCGFVPKDGINTLVLRSLVTTGDDNKLGMHDQLRDLGRQIIHEENLYKLSRVWHPKEALNVLNGGLGVENVEALNLDLRALESDEYEKIVHVKREYKQLMIEGKKYYVRRLKGQSFIQLQNLRFLQLGSAILDNNDSKSFFSNLRWLEWRCYSTFVPTNLNIENLVILNLSDSIVKDDWDGWTQFKAAIKLKALNMSQCLGLIRGPKLSTFKDLRNLNMANCRFIVSLPDVSNLIRLKQLLLKGCIKLRDIDGLGGLVSLEHLDMTGCVSIKKLPGLSKLRVLRNLILGYCDKLNDIEALGGLLSLEHLDMRDCVSITSLPELSNLRMLRNLRLKNCLKLHDIKVIGGLVSLEHLDIDTCKSIVRLPDLPNMSMLKTLIVSDNIFETGGELGGLISLEKFSVLRCDRSNSIKRLPDVSKLVKLKELWLMFLHELREIEGLSSLVSLECLALRYCSSLKNSLDLSCLKHLKKLNLKGMHHWTEIRGLEELKSLQVLDVTNCSSLEKLPDLSNHKSLKYIYTKGCTKLHERN